MPSPIVDATRRCKCRSSIDYSEFVGRIGIGRIFAGKIRRTSNRLLKRDGSRKESNIKRFFEFDRLGRTASELAAGDIAAVVGLDAPTLALFSLIPKRARRCRLSQWTSRFSTHLPHQRFTFVGREGQYVTSRRSAIDWI